MESPQLNLGLVVDFGGVLFDNGTEIVTKKLSGEYPHLAAVIHEIFNGDDSWRLRKGLIDSNIFWLNVKELQEKYPDLSQYDLREMWYSSFCLRGEISRLLFDVSPNTVLGAISGNIEERVQYLEKKYRFSSLFDFLIFSYDHKKSKRDRGLYEIAVERLDKLDVIPNNTLYVDDNLDCTIIAQSLGFKTHLYKTPEEFKESLVNHGLL